MSMLFRIIYATRASSTHHKLALDALRQLEIDNADDWRRLFLKHSDLYLEGAKAPDTEFKDFKNHVLHVADDYWGGAPGKAVAWYDKLVRALRDKQFEEAVYCAGVLSHYYTDPLQPFHTAQSEAENNMHRAVEWSIAKSYDGLRSRGLRDYSSLTVEPGDGSDWLADMVRRGAMRSHTYYQPLLSNYNLDAGVVDPLTGLNDNCHRFLSELIIYAATGYARILEKALREADVTPPQVKLSLATFVASLTIPLHWVLRKIEDAADRRAVEAAYDELQRTGKVERNLSEDDRSVRDLHQIEVIERRIIVCPDSVQERLQQERNRRTQEAAIADSSPAPAEPVSLEKKEKPAHKPAILFALAPDDDVERAPSIGRKTADRLTKVGVYKIQDLLTADASDLAQQLGTRWINRQTIRDWQDQARLVCEVAGLGGSQSQLLVAVGLRTPHAIARMTASEIHALVSLYCQTKDGLKLRACGTLPGIARIEEWISAAADIKTNTIAA